MSKLLDLSTARRRAWVRTVIAVLVIGSGFGLDGANVEPALVGLLLISGGGLVMLLAAEAWGYLAAVQDSQRE